MSIRTRMILSQTLLVVLPLALLGYAMRELSSRRLAEQYDRRVETLLELADARLAADRDDLTRRLAAIAAEAAVDQGLLLAAAGLPDRSEYPQEFTARAATLGDLDYLELLDGKGVVRGSGDGAAATGDDDRFLMRALRRTPDGTGLLLAGKPPGPYLVQIDSARVGDRTWYLIGGRAFGDSDLASLTSDRDVSASLVYNGGALVGDPDLEDVLRTAGRDSLEAPQHVIPTDRYLVRAVPFPRVRSGVLTSSRRIVRPLLSATLILTHPRAPWLALVRDLNVWLLGLLLATAAGGLFVSILLSVRLTQPLRELARRAEELDLEHLDVTFAGKRRDETGVLARALDAAVTRLRDSLAREREAERRAAVGDLARQVNHDLRNGIIPLRNVLRHMERVAEDQPERLNRVFTERRATLAAGLSYLEELAGGYKRLSRPSEQRPCDLNAVAAQVGHDHPGEVTVSLAEGLPPVLADPTALRRIVDNLVRNGLESRAGTGNEDVPVEVATAHDADAELPVRLTVRDHGCGMDEELRRRATEMFTTTKPEGSGLGLAIVRRLTGDAGGELTLDSEPGSGTTVTVAFPAAAPAGEDGA